MIPSAGKYCDQRERRHRLRRTAAPVKTTVAGTATAPAPALALWLASAEASTRAYAQAWQPAMADYADVPPLRCLGRRFCSEALEIARAICSWFALSCSAVLAFSRANSAWLALSCSISCCTLARSRAIVWSNCVTSARSGRLPHLAVRSEPEVVIAKVLRPPQPPEQQAGSAGRRAPVFPTATTKRRLRRPPGDHLPGRLAIGLRSESSETDARCQQQGDEAAQRRPATRRPTKLVRGLLLRLEICSSNLRNLFIARAICS